MSESPRKTARLAGTLYLISAVPAGLSVSVFRRLVVRGDPAATAANILGSEGLFRLGFVAEIIGVLFYLAALVFLYLLLRAVHRGGGLLLLVLGLVGAGVQVLDSLQDLTALALLKGDASLGGPVIAQGLALVHLRLHMLTYNLALVFFGCATLVMAWLILRSRFLPRILGVLIAADGAGYLFSSLANFLSPAFAAHLPAYLPVMTAILGEVPLMLWLVIRGVDAPRWEEQAARSGPPAL